MTKYISMDVVYTPIDPSIPYLCGSIPHGSCFKVQFVTHQALIGKEEEVPPMTDLEVTKRQMLGFKSEVYGILWHTAKAHASHC